MTATLRVKTTEHCLNHAWQQSSCSVLDLTPLTYLDRQPHRGASRTRACQVHQRWNPFPWFRTSLNRTADYHQVWTRIEGHKVRLVDRPHLSGSSEDRTWCPRDLDHSASPLRLLCAAMRQVHPKVYTANLDYLFAAAKVFPAWTLFASEIAFPVSTACPDRIKPWNGRWLSLHWFGLLAYSTTKTRHYEIIFEAISSRCYNGDDSMIVRSDNGQTGGRTIRVVSEYVDSGICPS